TQPGGEDPQRARAPPRDATGDPQGTGTGPRGASVPGGEVRLRLRQDALQGPGEEHRPDRDAVCAGESVRGAKAVDAEDGSIAPAVQVSRGMRARSRENRPRKSPKL